MGDRLKELLVRGQLVRVYGLGQLCHPKLVEMAGLHGGQTVEHGAQAARVHGIPWAILPPPPDYARRCVALGCRMLSLGLDRWTVHNELRTERANYPEWFD